MTIRELSDGTKYVKAQNYDGRVLKGTLSVYRKIDGVRALRLADGTVVSRNSKPLHNLNHLHFLDAEIFRKDWNTSVSLVRTHGPQAIYQEDVYELTDGNVDERLLMRDYANCSCPDILWRAMDAQVAVGDEGIVVRQEHNGKINWWKLVPEKNADVRITGYKEGTGKHKGRLGSFLTAHGSVGTGFDDEQRAAFWQNRDEMVGQLIEVTYRETTEAGKLRFPAFKRVRMDKDEESV